MGGYYNENDRKFCDKQGYTAYDIVIKGISGVATAVEGIDSSIPDITAPMYNLQGQQVGADYRGIVIQNGKKRFRK